MCLIVETRATMTDAPDPGASTLSPDEAFGVLGNETRMEILQVLADADDALSFSELRTRVGMRDSGRFNYHLDQVVGHFVQQTVTGYELARPGQRVIEAVLSGAVTESPVIERTSIDWRCHYCDGGPLEVDYREEQVGVYCPDCEGLYGGERDPEESALPAERERLYYMRLPPAGIAGRDPEEVILAASRWTNAESVTTAFGICPRCSARLDESVAVCGTHARTDRLCPDCNRRYAVLYETSCTNCVFETEIVLGNKLLTNLEVRAFLIEHGMNPLFPQSKRFRETFIDYDEEVRSVDPLEVILTFAVDDDAISVTVDDAIEVVDVTRGPTTEPDD